MKSQKAGYFAVVTNNNIAWDSLFVLKFLKDRNELTVSGQSVGNLGYFKGELNLFKYRLVPKMKLTLPIVQNICRIVQNFCGQWPPLSPR